jgi:hypothetical protein
MGDHAFSNNRITSITLPADVELWNETFDVDFRRYYNGNGRKGGTYTNRMRLDGTREWTYRKEGTSGKSDVCHHGANRNGA